MQGEQRLSFGPYRLNATTGQLWRGKQVVKLTPKALAVLRHFVERPGQVVTKEELFRAAWPGTIVSDAALSYSIRELRRALRDDAKDSRYIETVHRRGFRFIAPLTTSPVPVHSLRSQVHSLHAAIYHPSAAIGMVGRGADLSQLHHWFANALGGDRQLIFVTGEPGIGKTTLVEAFLAQVADEGTIWIGRGQCIEHYGEGEGYLPLLEALGRLCRGRDGQQVCTILEQYAPTWLIQMPSLLTTKTVETLQRKVAGATRGRMLRELAEALEALSAERALILCVEDLQWSDYSTLDVLTLLGRRHDWARLLMFVTYRPVDVLVRKHPLQRIKHELHLHGHCQELVLDFLSEAAVTEYLARRFPVGAQQAALLHKLAHLIHQRTDGNPLFMVNLVDHLLSQGVLVEADGQWILTGEGGAVAGVPESLRQMIEQRCAQVEAAERTVLEVASVAGVGFPAATVAAGIETTVEAVEEHCAALARRELFLRVKGTADWPDGTRATRYGFLHALYQEVLYDRMSASRRTRLHQQIGERIEAAYGARAEEIVTELALHFERGRDYPRAVLYHRRAAEQAIRRSAYPEAIHHLRKGLTLLKTCPDTPERPQQELTLLMRLGMSLAATVGYGAPEVEQVYVRARALCEQVQEFPQLLSALQGLCVGFLERAQYQTARDVAEQMLTLAHRGPNPNSLLTAELMMGAVLHLVGELALAREHLERSTVPRPFEMRKGFNFYHCQMYGRCYTANTLWMLGYPDQPVQKIDEALRLAQELGSPFVLAEALGDAALVHLLRKEGQRAQVRAEQCLALSTEHAFVSHRALATERRGEALAQQGRVEEGVALMREGLAAYQAIGATIARSNYLTRLAEAYGKVGWAAEGLSLLTEALTHVDKTGERFYEAELYRVKGELTLQSRVQGPQFTVEEKAEGCFLKAIEVARQQHAKSWELRATTSLARLWQSQGRKAEAWPMLGEIYGWFTEGFDTKDLQDAKTLLQELA